MAEIVLDNGITTIVIRIESLPVPFGILSAYLIKLDNRVITTPGPDTRSGIFYPQKIRTIPHYIMFYQCTVAGNRNNPVSRNLLDQVPPDNDIQTGKPFVTTTITITGYSIPLATVNMAILYQ